MSILRMSLSIPVTPNSLSSAEALSGGPISARFPTNLTQLSLPYKTAPIRMGGGPRTFPGGVSKWQWKKMQAKKAKQLLRARLARERQIYEMRKRAELKADIFELERPWETVEKPPNLFSVGADEQLKVLADRFQKPGGLDLWSERDGPELFRHDNGLPSARFFPKGVVHSIKPYRKTDELAAPSEEFGGSGLGEGLNPSQVSEKVGQIGLLGNGNSRSNQNQIGAGRNVAHLGSGSLNGVGKQGENRNFKGKGREKGSTRLYSSDSEGNARFHNRDDRRSTRPGDDSGQFRRNGYKSDQSINSEGKNYGNARFVDRDDRRSRRPGDNSAEFRRSNGYKSDQSMNSGGKNYGNARNLNRDDRRSGGSSDSSAEFRRSNSYKKDQSMNSDGNARFHSRDDRSSHNRGESSGEFRRSNNYKKDQIMNSGGNARFDTRNDRGSRNAGESSAEFRRSNSYKKDQSMNSGGNARFDTRNDRGSSNRSDYSGEFRRSNSYKKDQSMNSGGNARFDTRNDRESSNQSDYSGEFRRSNSYKKSEVFDLNLHNDGSYGFELGDIDDAIDSAYLGR